MKKMKKITTYLLVLTGLFLASCSEWLDLRPESEIVLEDYWKTEAQASAVLSACYRGLITDPVVERMLVWGEVRSDNVTEGSSIILDVTRILNVNITPTNSYAYWGDFYSIINNCNTFLHFAPEVVKADANFSPSELKTMEAEVLSIRALAYFYLIRTFRDVPLILEPSLDDTQKYNVPKATEREVLDQIIEDLLIAKQNIRKDYGRGAYNKGRFTYNAVNALLADVYLWDEQYLNCVNACDEVLSDNSLELVDGEKLLNAVFFQGNSTESIFELQFDKDVQYNNTVNNYYGYAGNKFSILSFPLYLTTKGSFSPFNFAASAVKESVDDIRETDFFGTSVNGTGYSIYKYALSEAVKNADETVSPVYRPSSNTTNWIIYRLSDVILMKAEALVQLNRDENDLKEALRLVNKTYLRANINLKGDSLQFNNYAEQGVMEKLVLRERQRELMFEGKRWFDLLRLARRKDDPTAILAYISPKLSGDNMQIKKLSVMDALYMPILKSELEIDTNLVQNPFYDEDSEFMK
jgi:hypothetical protein